MMTAADAHVGGIQMRSIAMSLPMSCADAGMRTGDSPDYNRMTPPKETLPRMVRQKLRRGLDHQASVAILTVLAARYCTSDIDCDSGLDREALSLEVKGASGLRYISISVSNG